MYRVRRQRMLQLCCAVLALFIVSGAAFAVSNGTLDFTGFVGLPWDDTPPDPALRLAYVIIEPKNMVHDSGAANPDPHPGLVSNVGNPEFDNNVRAFLRVNSGQATASVHVDLSEAQFPAWAIDATTQATNKDIHIDVPFQVRNIGRAAAYVNLPDNITVAAPWNQWVNVSIHSPASGGVVGVDRRLNPADAAGNIPGGIYGAYVRVTLLEGFRPATVDELGASVSTSIGNDAVQGDKMPLSPGDVLLPVDSLAPGFGNNNAYGSPAFTPNDLTPYSARHHFSFEFRIDVSTIPGT